MANNNNNNEVWVMIERLPLGINHPTLKEAFKKYNPKRAKVLWRRDHFIGKGGLLIEEKS